VLTPGGRFLLCDFSEGRRSPNDDALADWFAAFEQRFPWPADWRPLDPRELPLAPGGAQLVPGNAGTGLRRGDLTVVIPGYLATLSRADDQ
jgi:hypothetical protein